MKKPRWISVIVTGLVTTSILLGGCTGKPQTDPKIEIHDAAEAREAALSYLEATAGDNAPSPDGDWSADDITPELLGASAWEFTQDDWTVTVRYPVVAPENTIYTVEVESQDGWYWKGTVEAMGHVAEIVPFERFSEERSLEIAREFITNSPTFAFDGIEESLELVETLYPDIEFAWQFAFKFDSRHPGYGNRSGEVLAQVITPHEVSIAVERYQVISAIIDNQWDMIQQEMID